MTFSVSKENLCHIFLEFSKVGRNPSSTSQRADPIVLLLPWWEITAIVTTDASSAWGEESSSPSSTSAPSPPCDPT
jgi:hypothetical protein